MSFKALKRLLCTEDVRKKPPTLLAAAASGLPFLCSHLALDPILKRLAAVGLPFKCFQKAAEATF